MHYCGGFPAWRNNAGLCNFFQKYSSRTQCSISSSVWLSTPAVVIHTGQWLIISSGSKYITVIPFAFVGYNHFISNKGKWNNCFSKFSNRVLPPIFISAILQSVCKENLAHYFPYDVKLQLLAHSRSFLANQKARNGIVGAENLLKSFISTCGLKQSGVSLCKVHEEALIRQ